MMMEMRDVENDDVKKHQVPNQHKRGRGCCFALLFDDDGDVMRKPDL
jgi:hypothetical protein